MKEQHENAERRQFSQIANELKSIHSILKDLKKEITMIKKNIKNDRDLLLKNETEQTANTTTRNPSNNQQSGPRQDSFRDLRNLLSNANSLTVASNDDRTKPPLNIYHGKTTINRNEMNRKTNDSHKKKLDSHENNQTERTNERVTEIENNEYKKQSSVDSTSKRTPSRKKNNDNKFSQIFRRK